MAVYLEQGRRRVVACAVDWPGWCGCGASEQQALAALVSSAPRYALLAQTADIPFPGLAGPGVGPPGPAAAGLAAPGRGDRLFAVTERLGGSAAADRGAPGLVPACDARPVDAPTAQRSATLLTAAWAAFYQVSGGRATSKLVDHVIDADLISARKLGIRRRRPSIRDAAGIVALREEITAVVGRPSDGSPPVRKGWPARYAARQIAWHVLDHIWQVQDGGPDTGPAGRAYRRPGGPELTVSAAEARG